MNKNTLKKVFPFYVSYQIAVSFGAAFTNLWFLKHDFSYLQIVSFSFVNYLTPVLLIFFINIFNTIQSFRLAILLSMANSLLLLKFFGPFQPYLISLFSGAILVLFYAGYNITHFNATAKNQAGISASLMFLVGPILGIFIPILTGVIATEFGFQANFILGLLLYVIPLIMTTALPFYNIKYSISNSLRKIDRLWSLLFVEGLIESTVFTAIPVFTLFFIKTPLELGLFSSYLVTIAAVSNLIFGKVSDNLKNRKFFIYPFTLLLAISVLGLALSNTLILWGIFAAMVNLFITLSWPFMTTLVVDVYPDSKMSMIPREFLLNAGRVVGIIIIFLSLLLLGSPKYAIFAIGMLFLSFPIILARKKIY